MGSGMGSEWEVERGWEIDGKAVKGKGEIEDILFNINFGSFSIKLLSFKSLSLKGWKYSILQAMNHPTFRPHYI